MNREQVQKIKKEWESDLIARSGVTGVATGFKVVGGKTTDQLSVRVYVAKKKDVPEAELIPGDLGGVPTDVIERRYVAMAQRMPAAAIVPFADANRYDPLRGGISIGPCRLVDGDTFGGTLGAVVSDNASGEPMLLSAFHVLAIDGDWTTQDTACQPSRLEGGNCPGDVVGELARAQLQGTTNGSGPGVDCAVVAMNTARGSSCDIVDIGEINGTRVAEVGMAVQKRGCSTGLTHGHIDAVDLTLNMDMGEMGTVTLVDQISVATDETQSATFGFHGDSGACIMDSERRVVAMIIAGTEEVVDNQGNTTTPAGFYALASPIDAVLDALEVKMCEPTPESWPEKQIPENKRFKDHKGEKLEFKEFKEWGPKELKELEPKSIKEAKEIKELSESGIGTAPFENPVQTRRLEQLEGQVRSLQHFIRRTWRPDMRRAALRNEPDKNADEERPNTETSAQKKASRREKKG